MRERLVAARTRVRAALEPADPPLVEFYDPERVNAAAPLRDNLLFGRVNHSAANAQRQVTEAMTALIDAMNLRGAVERVGLDHQVGPAGRMLSAPQRASVNIVRCLIKRPDIFVVDGALAPFGEARTPALVAFLIGISEDRTLVMTLPNEREAGRFDAVLRVQDGKAVLERRGEASESAEPARIAQKEEAPAPEPGRKRVAGGTT
jgi:putative ABC transport system ATP-binding protein